MKHKPYPKYKPSGIDWIGDIPEGWGSFQLRRCVQQINNGTTATQLDYVTEFPVTRIETISSGSINFEKVGYIEEADVKKKDILSNGDILLSHINSLVYVGNCAIYNDHRTLVHGMNLLRLILPKCISSEFLIYYLKGSVFKNQIQSIAKHAINQVSLPISALKSLLIAIPNKKEEQEKIANFLDQKTAQIDDLIQKKEEMVKLLKEKRAAVINQAVTKGLDPNAKMKPSGIDWIGDIPGGWDVRRLKFIASTKFSNVDKHAKEEEQPVSLCNYVDVYYNDFIDSNMDFMQATATNDEIRKFALNKGDVIVTKDSESWDDIAIPAYVKEDMHGVLCGYHLAIIQANQNMCGEYVFWSFLSQIINYQFQVSATGVTRYGLGKGALDNAMFFAPSKKEQHKIANYLYQKTTEIDGLIQKIESAIDKLREYRSSLITAAVTGKIDVRGAVKC